jgi:hypothetical protein
MLTLGNVVAEWIAEVLPSLGDPSRPFILTDQQARFVMAWYAIDERGRYLYRRGLVQMAKGWGKSPLGAALVIAEFAGPVLFDGFDASRRPVGRPWGSGDSPPPWVQVAASSEDQANSNVYSLVWALLSENDGAAAEKLKIDQGRTRLYRKDSPASKLEAVTSEAGSREGQRVTFALFDESHLWTKQSGGLRLARTIRRNAGKMSGRTLECANAFETGAGSVAELTADAFEAGEPGILYMHNVPGIEPTPEMTDDELARLLNEVYGNVAWIDTQRILQEVRDPGTPWEESKRYYFNLAASGLDALVDASTWATLGAPVEPVPESMVALALVGPSTSSACVVLVTEDYRACVADLWEGDKDFEVPRAEVERTIAAAFDKYDVRLFYLDPRGWRTEGERWAEEFGDDTVVAFPTNSPVRMAPVVDRFRTEVASGRLFHDADSDLARHVADARLRAGRLGHTVEPAPGRSITACLATMLALEARHQMSDSVVWPQFAFR